jgi:hypothetical protein
MLTALYKQYILSKVICLYSSIRALYSPACGRCVRHQPFYVALVPGHQTRHILTIAAHTHYCYTVLVRFVLLCQTAAASHAATAAQIER